MPFAQLRVLSTTDWAVLAVALALIRASTRLGMWPYALVALPGTLAHELAHFLVAWLLAAKPSFPSLVPERSERGWRLRSVPIALAPLALAPLALCWAVIWMAPAHGWHYGVQAWIVAALISASLPSSADVKIALPALTVLAVISVAAWLLLR